MVRTEFQIANTLALSIIKAEELAEEYKNKNKIEEMNAQYIKAETLRELVDELGIDKKYIGQMISQLRRDDIA